MGWGDTGLTLCFWAPRRWRGESCRLGSPGHAAVSPGGSRLPRSCCPRGSSPGAAGAALPDNLPLKPLWPWEGPSWAARLSAQVLRLHRCFCPPLRCVPHSDSALPLQKPALPALCCWASGQKSITEVWKIFPKPT